MGSSRMLTVFPSVCAAYRGRSASPGIGEREGVRLALGEGGRGNPASRVGGGLAVQNRESGRRHRIGAGDHKRVEIEPYLWNAKCSSLHRR